MSLTRRIGLTLALLLCASPLARADGDFALKDGDRVVFYGDSITDQRLYTTFVETYVVTRFPDRNITFVHSGWGGDRVTGGGGGPIDTRLKRDVIAYKPDVVTIMLGMNDASYRPFDEKIFDTYTNGYKHLVDSLQEALPDVRLTLIEPSPFDDVTRDPAFEGGYNKVLLRYAEFVEELAKQEKANVADLNTPVVEALEKAEKTDEKNAERIVPDRVHPGPAGHLIMAEALLKSWNAPAVVTSVTIDASGKKVAAQENTEVTGLKAEGEGLAWTQQDKALPMPISMDDPVVALAVKSSDVVQAIDEQPLKVTGLSASNYDLKIDGESVGTFTREALAEGINLALLPTPMAKQAAEVHSRTLEHNNVHFIRWRQLQVPYEGQNLPHMEQAIQGLDALEADLISLQRKAAQPKPHNFELTPKS